MNEKMARCTGLILLVVAASVGLSTCGSSSTDSLAPTAIAVKRYMGTGATAGALDAAGFSGGAVFTKIDPSEFEYAIAVALQADGKIIAVGHSVLGGQGVIALVRYKTDGSLDTVFGSSGVVRTAVPSVNAVGTAIAMQGTQILVAGSTFNPSTGMTGIAVVRYDANSGRAQTPTSFRSPFRAPISSWPGPRARGISFCSATTRMGCLTRPSGPLAPPRQMWARARRVPRSPFSRPARSSRLGAHGAPRALQ